MTAATSSCDGFRTGSQNGQPQQSLTSGTVVDANGSGFSDGDSIFGWLNVMGYAFSTRQGIFSQYIKIPARMVVRRPTHKTATETAGVTLAAITAYQGLYATANVQPGQTIFVNGGSSSVGAFAIQIAEAKGVKTVSASCSPTSADFVKSLGADEETLGTMYPEPVFDAIIDAVGLADLTLYTYSDLFLKPCAIFAATIPHPRSLALGALYQTAKLIWSQNYLRSSEELLETGN